MNTHKIGRTNVNQTLGPRIEADPAGATVPQHPSYGLLLTYMAKLPPSLIGIDACPGALNLARELHCLGHFVKIIYPPFPAR